MPKKKVQPDVSTTGAKDDIDKTIAALLNRRMQADPKTVSDPVTEIEHAVPSGSDDFSADPPLKAVRKRRKKAGTIPEENQRSSKQRKPLATQDVVDRDTALATAAPFKGKVIASLHPTSDHHTSSVQLPESEPGPVRRENLVRTMEDRSAVKGASSITGHIAKTAANVNSRPLASGESSVTLRVVTDHLSSGSASRVPFPERSASGERSRTGAKPTIPEGLAISGVPIEAHGEGSSDESSNDSDEDGEGTIPLAKPATPIADPSIPMNLFEDQLVALIRGPGKCGPRRSVLDEIPSSSETASESNHEDLMLDEEEDLSRQPSRKQKTLSKKCLSSIEPEPESTSEDERSSSSHVFMDIPNGAQHYPPVSILYSLEGSRKEIDNLSSKDSIAGEVEIASADGDTERGASEHPGIDTSAKRPLEGDGQDISGSVQTPSGKGHAPDTQPGANIPRTISPESDATAIDTEPTKLPILASTKQLSGRVLVPASSPFVTKVLVNVGEKVQTQDEIDDVEPADESIDGYKESDPIEPEPNEPSVDLSPHDPISPHPRRPASQTTLHTSPDSLEQPSRRSGRLANLRSSVATVEATPVLARQPDRKTSLSLKKSAVKEDHERTHNEMAGTTREKPAPKQVGKGRKPATTTQRSTNHTQEDAQHGAPGPSQVEWTTLPHPSETQPDGTSAIDQFQTSSPVPVRQLLPVGDDASQSADIGEDTPMPIRRGVTVAPQGKGGSGQPLFYPGSSHSQGPRTQIAPSPSASESESENVASVLPRKTPTRSTPGGGIFRSLSDLASQDILFPKLRAATRAFNNTPSLKVKAPFLEGEDDEESSSSGDDASEVPSKSHIPKERRAGATPRKKGRRLSSLAKLGASGRN